MSVLNAMKSDCDSIFVRYFQQGCVPKRIRYLSYVFRVNSIIHK